MSKDSEIEKEPRQINFPSIMSIKEAACYLTISTYFLYGLVKAGCVPYAKIENGLSLDSRIYMTGLARI